jgi:hypothetical protein
MIVLQHDYCNATSSKVIGIVLTYEDGTPLQRARGERWECRFVPGDDVELLAKRARPPAGYEVSGNKAERERNEGA